MKIHHPHLAVAVLLSIMATSAAWAGLPPDLADAAGLRITSPNGGETWTPGAWQTITWQDEGAGCPEVKLKLYKGDDVYAWITGRTPNDGEYTWRAPSDLPHDSDYRIKVYCVSDFALADFSDGPFSIAGAPELHLTSPDGGETWSPGGKYTITWDSALEPGERVKLKLFQDGQFVEWIAGSTPDDGVFIWQAPCHLPQACDYQVKIYWIADYSALDFSDAPFCMASDSALEVVSPNGGEVWTPSRSHAITWLAEAEVGESLKLKLYRDCLFVRWIAGAWAAAEGIYNWGVPCDLAPGPGYSIKAYSASDYALLDFSDEPFSVLEAPIQVTAPNGGEQWPRATTQTIVWDTGGLGDDVKLKLFRDCQFHSWIRGSIPNTGACQWAIPPDLEPGTGYRVKLYCASDYAIADFSDGEFSITD